MTVMLTYNWKNIWVHYRTKFGFISSHVFHTLFSNFMKCGLVLVDIFGNGPEKAAGVRYDVLPEKTDLVQPAVLFGDTSMDSQSPTLRLLRRHFYPKNT